MKRIKKYLNKDNTFIVFIILLSVYYTLELIRPWKPIADIHLLLIHTFFMFCSILVIQLVWTRRLRSEVAVGVWLFGFSITIIGLLLIATTKHDNVFVYVSILFLLYAMTDVLVKTIEEYKLYYGTKIEQEAGSVINGSDQDRIGITEKQYSCTGMSNKKDELK